MRTLIIGANGQTGFQVVEHLAAADNHEPVAMLRDMEQAERFEKLGVEVVKGDLLHPIDDAVKGCDAVIFAAGSGPKTGKDMTVLIDQLGAIRAAVAALQAGAKRFVLLSGFQTDPAATEDPIPHWRRAKGRADDFVKTMPEAFDGKGLDWTLVCPGTLHDEDDNDATPGIKLVDPTSGEGKTSRANTAAVLAACLDHPNTIGQSIGFIDGDQSPDDALASLK